MNEGYEYRERLGASARGRTVLEYLVAEYRHSNEQTWRARVEAGEVELDGAPATLDQPLAQGQTLCWRRPPWSEPEVPAHFDILHEDDDLLLVVKPSGLPTAPAGGYLTHTLLALVQRRDPRWAPMHRLGRGTSGLVVFARAPEARSRLQQDWRSGRVEKTYLALVEGSLPAAPFAITAPIGLVEHPIPGGLHAASPSGKAAHTLVRALSIREESSIAEVRIATGRPHQIRIHLAFAGHPLVGDPLYGPGGLPRPGTTALPGDLGYHLHAWRLRFAHPRSGEPLTFEAPAPALLRPPSKVED